MKGSIIAIEKNSILIPVKYQNPSFKFLSVLNVTNYQSNFDP